MYLPAVFAESDPAKLHEFIEHNSFGLLVSSVDGLPFATHLPLLLENGSLLGHVARANPQWQQVAGQKVLAVFSGPHAYVSPTWYEAEQVVPTWNYVAVHVYGTLHLVEGQADLLELVKKITWNYERSLPRPWSLAGTSAAFLERMLAQIVGFRIQIERIEGKWKLNQNQPLERRLKVAGELAKHPDENAQEIAALMRAMLPSKSED